MAKSISEFHPSPGTRIALQRGAPGVQFLDSGDDDFRLQVEALAAARGLSFSDALAALRGTPGYTRAMAQREREHEALRASVRGPTGPAARELEATAWALASEKGLTFGAALDVVRDSDPELWWRFTAERFPSWASEHPERR